MSNNNTWPDPDSQLAGHGRSDVRGVYLLSPSTQKAVEPSGGGGGGGAVTIADGADTTQGAMADTPATSDSGTFSLMALTKRLLAKFPAIGQQVKSASLSVTLASDQGALSTTDTNSAAMKSDLDAINTNTTGVATSANQATGNTSLASIATSTAAGATQATLAQVKTDLDTIATQTSGLATHSDATTINTTLGTLATDAHMVTNNTNTSNTATGVGGVADSAANNSTSSWSMIALLKGLYALLAGTLAMNISQLAGTTTATNAGTINAGTQRVVQGGAATGTKSNVASSASSVTILASNTSRKGAIIYNDSTQILYLDLSGGTATPSSYSVQVGAQGYFEVPGPTIYNGAITGIWAAANGNARVTEFS